MTYNLFTVPSDDEVASVLDVRPLARSGELSVRYLSLVAASGARLNFSYSELDRSVRMDWEAGAMRLTMFREGATELRVDRPAESQRRLRVSFALGDVSGMLTVAIGDTISVADTLLFGEYIEPRG